MFAPGLGNIKRSIHQHMAVLRAIGDENADLTILDPSGRARVLSADLDALRSFLKPTIPNPNIVQLLFPPIRISTWIPSSGQERIAKEFRQKMRLGLL